MNLKIIALFKLARPKKSIQYLSSEGGLPRGLEWKDYKGEQRKFGVDGNIHYLDCGFCSHRCILVKIYQSIHCKQMYFIVCQTQFNKAIKNKEKLFQKVVRIKLIHVKYIEPHQAPSKLSGNHQQMSDSVLGTGSTREHRTDGALNPALVRLLGFPGEKRNKF